MSDYSAIVSPGAPVDADEVRRLARHGCLDIHRVDWTHCYLSSDGLRMLCRYQAGDAESVRFVLRHQGLTNSTVAAAVATTSTDTSLTQDDRVVIEFIFDPPNSQHLRSARKSAITALADAHLPVSATIETANGNTLAVILSDSSLDEVRACLKAAGLEATAMWAGTEIDPHPSALFEATTSRIHFTVAETEAKTKSQSIATDFDAVIIGAGISGITAVQRLTSMGLRVHAYDSAGDVGGVWYWNRYPGARMDSETYSYALSFSDELIDEWDWPELFCGQPDIERYLQYVVEHFNLRRYFTFNTSITSVHFNEAACCWNITTDTDEQITAGHVIVASGTLSTPQFPDYPGMDSFKGHSVHTALWPVKGIELAGKRVGVVGTGASGVQVIQTIAAEVEHLTVFQRTPTYCVPQRNQPLTDDDRQQISEQWPDILAACRNSYAAFIHNFDERSGLAVTPQEREALLDTWWQTSGFAFWLGNFADVMMNAEVNEYVCEFVRSKIRQRVNDPDVAKRLVPDHPFGSKRVPLENGYYEVYNRYNVDLVDLRATPIEAITPQGIRTSNREYSLDVIIYATGFDAGTGSFNRIDIRGERGISMTDKWKHGPQTFLGLMVSGFPNLFIANGPQNPSALCNATRCIEYNVDWIADAIKHLRTNGLTRIAATTEAEQRWSDHVDDAATGTVLAANTDSWYYGGNTPGKIRRMMVYAPGARLFREHCEDVVQHGYIGCELS